MLVYQRVVKPYPDICIDTAVASGLQTGSNSQHLSTVVSKRTNVFFARPPFFWQATTFMAKVHHSPKTQAQSYRRLLSPSEVPGTSRASLG